MIGHVEEVPNEPKISLIAPIPTKCCEESFTNDIPSTQGSCQEEALKDNESYSKLSQDQEPLSLDFPQELRDIFQTILNSKDVPDITPKMFLSDEHINVLHLIQESPTLDISTQDQAMVEILDSYSDCASLTSFESTSTSFEVVSTYNDVIELEQTIHIRKQQEPITISCVHNKSYSMAMDQRIHYQGKGLGIDNTFTTTGEILSTTNINIWGTKDPYDENVVNAMTSRTMSWNSPIFSYANWDQCKKNNSYQSKMKIIKEIEAVKQNGRVKSKWIPKKNKENHPSKNPLVRKTMGKNKKGKGIHQTSPQIQKQASQARNKVYPVVSPNSMETSLPIHHLSSSQVWRVKGSKLLTNPSHIPSCMTTYTPFTISNSRIDRVLEATLHHKDS